MSIFWKVTLLYFACYARNVIQDTDTDIKTIQIHQLLPLILRFEKSLKVGSFEDQSSLRDEARALVVS